MIHLSATVPSVPLEATQVTPLTQLTNFALSRSSLAELGCYPTGRLRWNNPTLELLPFKRSSPCILLSCPFPLCTMKYYTAVFPLQSRRGHDGPWFGMFGCRPGRSSIQPEWTCLRPVCSSARELAAGDCCGFPLPNTRRWVLSALPYEPLVMNPMQADILYRLPLN